MVFRSKDWVSLSVSVFLSVYLLYLLLCHYMILAVFFWNISACTWLSIMQLILKQWSHRSKVTLIGSSCFYCFTILKYDSPSLFLLIWECCIWTHGMGLVFLWVDWTFKLPWLSIPIHSLCALWHHNRGMCFQQWNYWDYGYKHIMFL